MGDQIEKPKAIEEKGIDRPTAKITEKQPSDIKEVTEEKAIDIVVEEKPRWSKLKPKKVAERIEKPEDVKEKDIDRPAERVTEKKSILMDKVVEEKLIDVEKVVEEKPRWSKLKPIDKKDRIEKPKDLKEKDIDRPVEKISEEKPLRIEEVVEKKPIDIEKPVAEKPRLEKLKPVDKKVEDRFEKPKDVKKKDVERPTEKITEEKSIDIVVEE